jgi:predicted ester cyclase
MIYTELDVPSIYVLNPEAKRLYVFDKGKTNAEFFGVPTTGRHVTTSGIMIFRIENGQIQEWWHEYDLFGFMNQLTAK